MKVQIGEEIALDQDIELTTAIQEKTITARAGDRCTVTASGWLRFTTGDARGKMIRAGEGFEIEGYDNEGIAIAITRRLHSYFGMNDILQDYDIDQSDLINEIESVLDDIL